MNCPHCRKDTPLEAFCTFCGAELRGTEGRHRRRLNSYAAHPHQRVVTPGVFSTLLPHLHQERLHVFRLAGITGVAVMLGITALGYVGVALAGAAILVPVVFLLYLRETEVYRREPMGVLVRSLGWGILVGLVITGVANRFFGSAVGQGVDADQVVVLAVVVPLVADLTTPLLILPLRRRFAETVDGLTFGIAAGLGYALSETALNFSSVISSAASRFDAGAWILTVLSAGVLVPLVHATCVGAIAAGWWRWHSGRNRPLALVTIAAALTAHISFALGSQMLGALGAPGWGISLWQAVVVAGLLISVRMILHDALLDEAHDLGLSEQRCGHCAAVIEAAGFCPRCGLALGASPRVDAQTASAVG